MQKCCKCHREFDIPKMPGGYCKECGKVYKRDAKKRFQRLNRELWEKKKESGECRVCGEKSPACLIYYDESISKAFGSPPSTFQKKIAETILICLNCRAKAKAGILIICIP